MQIETLSGQPYDTIYLNENDSKYYDIKKNIMKNIKRPDYPEYNPYDFEEFTMYVKTDIKLFNKGKLINFDDDISFDKEDCVLQIFIKYEYVCYGYWWKVYYFTVENRYEEIIHLIKQDAKFINLLRDEEQTEEICKWAIQQNYKTFKYVKNQTEDICKFAVQEDGHALKFVKNQTEELCKLAVQELGYALRFVKIEQTEEICKLSVQQNGWTLQFVKIKTEEICKLAVQQNPNTLECVPENMKTEEICKLAVQQNPNTLEFVPENMKHLFM